MKYLIFFLSFSASAEICRVDWIAPTERVNETPLSLSEISHFNLYTDGGTVPFYRPDSSATRHIWWAITCPKCENIRIKTVDTGGLHSDLSLSNCNNPNPPLVCQ